MLSEHRLSLVLRGLGRECVGGLLAKTLKSRALIVEFLLFRGELPREGLPFGDRRVRAMAVVVSDRSGRDCRIRRQSAGIDDVRIDRGEWRSGGER